jgi:hypothetical protein
MVAGLNCMMTVMTVMTVKIETIFNKYFFL